MTTLTGTVDRVVFRSSDSEFAVARFRVEGVGDQRTYDDPTTIVGNLARVSPGELLKIGGEWERHPKHGRHFRVQWLEQKLPNTAAGIQRFLGSGIIKGVGPGTAERIVEWFGDNTLDIIENHPERLREIPKVSRRRADLIIQGWGEHHQLRNLLLFLQSHNLPPFIAKRLMERYGDQCVAVIQKDPYQLVQDVYGIGFKTADAIAIELGLSRVSASRFVAGMKHVLDEASREGHVFLPREELLNRAAILLGASQNQLEPGLLEASRQGFVIFDRDAVYSAPLYYAERSAAAGIQRLQRGGSIVASKLPDGAESTAKRIVASLGISLAPRQMDAIVMALREKVSIITGGPGTGKTMCLHAIISALDSADIPYVLCAPTGRAAKRMTAATGRPASTIHRLLGYQPATNDFAHNTDHQLDPQVVVVDEISMLDIMLANHLIKAVPDTAHLLLVGDGDQLPAVGPGNVLRDLLDSETVPSVVLDELFRQGQDSRITVAAHQIRKGELPVGQSGGDLFLVPVKDAESAASVIKEMVVRRIPARFGFDPILDIQVLSPTHRGPAGVVALNAMLQEALNPNAKDLQGTPVLAAPTFDTGRHRFWPGDKVMQMRNNYDKSVYNGDVGTVSGLDREEQVMTIRFGEAGEFREVDYDFSDLTDLALAYAASVHKSQGSEFPCVVMPLLTAHYPLLQRNLVYTGLTRARLLCVLVYQPKALAIAIKANNQDRRFTGLAERLRAQAAQFSHDLALEPLEAG
jgi:exodeoxyribonuclease V alpha subunit